MLIRIISLSLLVLAVGCKEVPMLPTLTPHKIDIRQGNYVTQEMVDKLKPGMTQKEVRFFLGTPLIVDPFRTDRWDYVYTYRHRGDLVEQRRLVVLFKDEKLVRLEGDVVPAKPKAEPVVADKPRPEPVVADKPKPDAPQATPEAAKAESAKPDAAPATLTTGDGKPVGSGASEPPKPAEAKPDAPQAKPEDAKAEPAKPDATPASVTPSTPTTVDSKPAGSAASELLKPAETKPDAAATKPPAEKPAEERGFFGRLLDRIGF